MTRLSPAFLVDEAREFFLLRDAERRASGIEPAVRDAFARDLERARQKRGAAELLWAQGSVAEALRLAREAVEVASAAVATAGLPEPTTVPETGELPTLDREVGTEHVALFQKLVDAHRAIDARIAPVALTADERGRARRARVITVVAVSLASIAALLFALLRPGTPRVEASATWGPRFAAENANDGIESSEWLLPDRTPGYLDVIPKRPRKVKALRVLNAWNKAEPERGTLEYEIEVFVGSQVVKRIPGNLGPYQHTPPWRTIDLGESRKISRVRFHVKTWTGLGGGLAEVALD